MLSRKTLVIATALIMSAAGSTAYAAELGAESIVHEQAQNERALAQQSQYLAYHDRFKDQHGQQIVPTGQLPHHN